MDINQKLSEEFSLKPDHVKNIVNLINEGNTIPFIARYRKEMHGACNDQVLREVADRLAYLTNLEKRKGEVKAAIEGQGKFTDEIGSALENAQTLTEVEDIYRPFKQKKKTRASVAVEKGLQPLADVIWAQELKEGSPSAVAESYVNPEKGVNSVKEALQGALDIIAERISDDAALRKTLRAYLTSDGSVVATAAKDADKEKFKVYETYAQFNEKVNSVPPHRILALNRGEADDCLKVSVTADSDAALQKVRDAVKKESVFDNLMEEAIVDSYERLIFPSVEREVRGELTDKACEQAIKMFEVNLRPLLMQPPLKGKIIMGLDPAYRTGCKIAVIDEAGNVLDYTVVYATPPKAKIEESKEILKKLIEKHNVDVISIGNGTASKESEIFVAELIKECSRPVSYVIVNEAGASVYSASKLGAEEFPNLDVSTRSAVSIARRLLDPLAELIKIDVKSIGVGQYQHDMPQKRLTEVLDGVVEDCVNSVGVDLNTASQSLLSRVAGLNAGVAKNIVEQRKKQPFKSRSELLNVSKLGPKAFEQCAGFLRIAGGESVLDNTAVHPESYAAAEKLLSRYGYTDEDVRAGKIGELSDKVKADGKAAVAAEIGVGEITLDDMVSELLKPGRDVRDSLPPVVLRADLLDLKDLKEGMELEGTVRNVIDFGAFVDIGVHHDGLVHISEISNGYIKHPSEALKVGDTVKVKVIGVDIDKQRINLSMKQASGAPAAPERKKQEFKKPQNNGGKDKDMRRDYKGGKDNRNNGKDRNRRNDNRSLEDMLAALQNKYKKH
ncbi:MAG: RNA-binding transcriptional accessory protein [Clostridia bacterium]|nr:RNA-binding transcriptional accessory protein [Clostridia bacterium]